SDGTDAGTLMVKDLVPGSDSSLPGSVSGFPGAFTDGGGTLFFTANDGAHGYELWRSDGTDAGTVSVQDINPGSEGSFPSGLIYIAAGSTPVRLVR
ncbi:MAG: ELWxxDGT repeat protein, partial [Actinomycetota bacterium]